MISLKWFLFASLISLSVSQNTTKYGVPMGITAQHFSRENLLWFVLEGQDTILCFDQNLNLKWQLNTTQNGDCPNKNEQCTIQEDIMFNHESNMLYITLYNTQDVPPLNAYVAAISTSGSIQWKFPWDAYSFQKFCSGPFVMLGNADIFMALDAYSGRHLWETSYDSRISCHNGFQDVPGYLHADSNTNIVFGSCTANHYWAWDYSGNLLWVVNQNSSFLPASNFGFIDGNVISGGGQLCSHTLSNFDLNWCQKLNSSASSLALINPTTKDILTFDFDSSVGTFGSWFIKAFIEDGSFYWTSSFNSESDSIPVVLGLDNNYYSTTGLPYAVYKFDVKGVVLSTFNLTDTGLAIAGADQTGAVYLFNADATDRPSNYILKLLSV